MPSVHRFASLALGVALALASLELRGMFHPDYPAQPS
jgi:hypothetical protein